MTRKPVLSLIAMLFLVFYGLAPAWGQVDADAAEALARKNACFTCHSIEKTKVGPPYKLIAARLKSKPDGVETIIEHITTGPLIELPGGSQEKHRVIDTKDPRKLRNLAEWILSL